MKVLTLTIPKKCVTIGSRIGLANTSRTRLFGLLGRRSLDPGAGLLIQPSSGVHTFFMLFSIDVVALDRNLQVLGVWRRLPPFRVTPISLKSYSSLELAPGEIDRCGIEPGDQLLIAQ
jgi:uncharacterized protein